MKKVTSLNVRVARDISGVGDGVGWTGNLLIIGPPGSGKTTMLRDLARRLSRSDTVAVVDERGELFPDGFDNGRRLDVLTGCAKPEGIEMALRTMGPDYIVTDEITAEADCRALESAAWCGARILATAHAIRLSDLRDRVIYRPLLRQGLFDRVLVMERDKTWHLERLV